MLPVVCIDVDGTLVGRSGEPTDVVWAAAAAAVARGQHLVLTTARGALGPTWEHARRLDPDGWHIFHNGAALVHSATGELRQRPLDAEIVAACVEVARRRSWVCEVYAARDYVVELDVALTHEHAALLGVPARLGSPDSLGGEIVRIQLVVRDVDIDAALASAPPGAVAALATSPAMPGSGFVSITGQGVDKAGAIAELAGELDADLADVMMIGDGENDLDAIRRVGHGVAMGNAVTSVAAAARHLVAHVDDDGVAEALELSSRL